VQLLNDTRLGSSDGGVGLFGFFFAFFRLPVAEPVIEVGKSVMATFSLFELHVFVTSCTAPVL